MGSTRDESVEETLEEERGLNLRSSKRLRFLEDKRRSLRGLKRVRYHLEEQEEGHEHTEEEGNDHDEEVEDSDVTWFGPGSASWDTLTQRTPNRSERDFI